MASQVSNQECFESNCLNAADPVKGCKRLELPTISSPPSSIGNEEENYSSSYNVSSHRKGIPKRSPSWADDTPGIIFKLNHEQPVVLMDCNGTSSIRNTPGSKQPGGFSLQYSGSTLAFSINNAAAKMRSKSISGSGSVSGSFPGELPSYLNRRHRSNSVSVPDDENVDVLAAGEQSDGDIPTQPISTAIGRNRKSSICSESGGIAYTGSLSHLIPNRLLMTTSRRISVNSSAEGCFCASCHSQITPYWRDGWAEDVMLCNACGLRFQKFARRCPSCIYIPRKEDSLGDRCIKCGSEWAIG